MAISSPAFGVLVWVSVGIVLVIFVYVTYAVLSDAGWVAGRSSTRK